MGIDGRLGIKKLHVIERRTGIKPTYGIALFPYYFFRDADDRHFYLHRYTGDWGPDDNPNPHFTSCYTTHSLPSS